MFGPRIDARKIIDDERQNGEKKEGKQKQKKACVFPQF